MTSAVPPGTSCSGCAEHPGHGVTGVADDLVAGGRSRLTAGRPGRHHRLVALDDDHRIGPEFFAVPDAAKSICFGLRTARERAIIFADHGGCCHHGIHHSYLNHRDGFRQSVIRLVGLYAQR